MTPPAAGGSRRGRTPVVTKDDMRLVLLDCMEWFRDELYFGTPTARQEARMTQLRDACARVLGDPSVADAARIRERGGRTNE